ncbi:hypothetical protein ILUMI_26991 [Ignelater luminosus]|uniref:Uncharacterized protein n=1 Tax=Ignelater luminosus TaxID=2038154 RepID=A0A8K0C5T5_IGNLU|nr:hypothetical protein ILUMI_26991 [Ignelater luminosus]
MIQPLDKTVIGALKTFYIEEIRISLKTNQRVVSLFDVGELFGPAYVRVQPAERTIKGFATTGLYPSRRSIFNDEDFLEQHIKMKMLPQLPIHNQRSSTQGKKIKIQMQVNPEDISPIPTLKKKVGTQGRKPGKAKIITSIPNKEELEESVRII